AAGAPRGGVAGVGGGRRAEGRLPLRRGRNGARRSRRAGAGRAGAAAARLAPADRPPRAPPGPPRGPPCPGGPGRDELVRQQRDWLELIANVARTGITEGDFRPGLDGEQLAYDLYGVMLAYHHARRLLRDPRAPQRARSAFDALVEAARTPRPARASRARASRSGERKP